MFSSITKPEDTTIVLTTEMQEIVEKEYPNIASKAEDYASLKALADDYYKKMGLCFQHSRESWELDMKAEAKKFSDLGKAYKILLHFANQILREAKQKEFQKRKLMNYSDLKDFITSNLSDISKDLSFCDAQDSRNLASFYATEMKNNYSLSQKAWSDGNKSEAKKFSEKGDENRKNMEYFHKEAAKISFATNNNNDNKNNVLDLHGLTVEEAEVILEDNVEKIQKKGEKELMVIVGKGLHSGDEGPKLKELVMNYAMIMNYKYKFEEKNQGCIILYLP